MKLFSVHSKNLNFKLGYVLKINGVNVLTKKKDSVEVTEAETFATYSEKLKQKYGDNWLGKGKGTGLEVKRWLSLRDNKTEIP